MEDDQKIHFNCLACHEGIILDQPPYPSYAGPIECPHCEARLFVIISDGEVKSIRKL